MKKRPKRGDLVTVRAYRGGVFGPQLDAWRVIVLDPSLYKLSEEDVLWARGWKTPAARALQATIALEASR